MSAMPAAHRRARADLLGSRTRRPKLRPLLSVTVLLVVTVLAAPAAGSEHDVRDRQREVQRKRAAAAAQVDVLKASEAELATALDSVANGVRRQEARVADAGRAAEMAVATLNAARARETEAETALLKTQTRMKSLAVQTYMRGGQTRASAALSSASIGEVARKQAYLDVAVDDIIELEGTLRAAREDLAVARGKAEAAARIATERRSSAEEQLQTLRRAQREKEELAAAVEVRLERTLAEAASLESVDRQLSAELARRQAELARRIQSTRPPLPPRAARSSVRSGSIQLTTVRGITVNVEMADQLERLLAAAESDGFVLSGGGYRSSDGQVAARRANCGTSDYDVYEKPASQCSPPTARPGQSMHEQGLAVDFTHNGRIITSRSNPAFRWLASNASRYGIYNLPAEPWHWSTNGN